MHVTPRNYIWKTKSVIPETHDTVTIEFDTGGEAFAYKAGQFINLTLHIDGKPVTRSYSMSSVPGESGSPSITVKKVNGGLLSNYIVDNARTIQHWRIDGPYGSFITPEKSDHLVLLTGGSGITPLFSILRYFLNQADNTRVTLIYSNRTEEDIIFNEKLVKSQQLFKERFTIIHVLSKPRKIKDLVGTVIESRLNKIILKKLLRQAVGTSSAHVKYFICGPGTLMKMHHDALIAMQVSDDKILVERFVPEPVNNAVVLPDKTHEVLLHFYERSNLLEVAPGTTILTAALTDRVPLPYSCKAGTCGKCVAKLTAGNVSMPNNYSLRKDELEAGLILLCQSYPLNDEVTVEIA